MEQRLGGYIVRIVPVCLIGVPYTARARTHKKKRIDKKWLKRYGYVTKYRDDHKAIALGPYVYMTEETYEMLKEEVNSQNV